MANKPDSVLNVRTPLLHNCMLARICPLVVCGAVCLSMLPAGDPPAPVSYLRYSDREINLLRYHI